jgi:PAS domain-containing protein
VSDRLDAEKAAALLGTCDALSLTEAVARLPPNAKGVLDTHDRSLLDGIMNAQQCFVLTDPNLPDNPIVYASAGFQRLTQYTSEQVLGRNCRFMQGPDTDPKSVETLREGIKNAVDTSVVMLNYKVS